MRWLLTVAAVTSLALAAPALAEQDVYLEPALRGIEIYPPRLVYPQTPAFSAYEVELIRAEVSQVPEKYVKRFGPRFTAWKGTWVAGVASIDNIEYDLLARMGRPILPLVVEQLLLEENTPALTLYDHVAPLEWYVGTPPGEPFPAPVAQRIRVLRTIRRWFELSRKASYERHD